MPIVSGDVVVAQGSTQSEWDFLAIAGNKPTWAPTWGYTTQTDGNDPRFKIGGAFHGWFHGVVGTGGYTWDDKAGPDPNAYSRFAGALGTGVYVTGVAGTSIFGHGVYGQTGEFPALPQNLLPAGVFGASEKRDAVVGRSKVGNGVVGNSSIGTGVFGTSRYNGVAGVSDIWSGVSGVSSRGTGVFGSSTTFCGVYGLSGDIGPLSLPGFYSTAAVFGSSDQQIGVVGTSNALMGVYGYSTNSYGVVGRSANPRSYGGYFFGNVMITGNLTVNGRIFAGVKDAIVPFPDGTQRVLHCMESPEHWFEDFGAAKLKRGRVTVRLDADFAKVVKTNGYHVFVTPTGNCRGLYVHRKRAATFEVRELAVGTSNVAFSYRIVAHRKDIRGHQRFPKIDTRLSLPAAATRAPRKGAPTAAALRTFVARLQKEAQEKSSMGARVSRTPRALPKDMKRPSIRPRLQLPKAQKK